MTIAHEPEIFGDFSDHYPNPIPVIPRPDVFAWDSIHPNISICLKPRIILLNTHATDHGTYYHILLNNPPISH